MKTFSTLAPNISFKQSLASLISIFLPEFCLKPLQKQNTQQLAKILNLKSSQISLTHQARSAIFMALKTSQQAHPNAKQVLLAGYTCRVLINPILKLGLEPIFIDIQSSNLSMDLESISKHCSKNTLAVIVQNTFGTQDPLGKIHKLVRQNNLDTKIISDLAHCLPTAGELGLLQKRSDFAILSFANNKTLGVGPLAALCNFSTLKLASLPKPPQIAIVKALLKNFSMPIFMAVYNFANLGKLALAVFAKLRLYPKINTQAEKSLDYQKVHFYADSYKLALVFKLALNGYTQKATHMAAVFSIYQANLAKSLQYQQDFLTAPLFFPVKTRSPKKLYKKLAKQAFQLNLDWSMQPLVPFHKNIPETYHITQLKNAQAHSENLLCLPINNTVSYKDAITIAKLINRYEK